ncbi:DUF6382 domain-containing protein [Paenibacillus eucommiae]|uniref:FHA domain-containing protein n=1 Tax=Paenibacillus eucommiae TaxID=1355755 RepID=A0ABS4J5Z2_9BACL|nr:DUF6382 domain-containing protein [Paenibacillus eucommiae]MBP1995247.1 hypothetical protein [Paenibacillus eucommiae]
MDVTQEIYGMRYEFVHRRGITMKLYREAGITANELSSHQLRMLESNAIPKLLPLEIEEADLRITFLYNLQAARMLSHVIKTEGLSRVQALKLLYTIICAVHSSDNYMLNETQYLLDSNFIFVGSEWTDIYLTYLPFQLLVGEIPLHNQIAKLIEELVEKVDMDERGGLENLLSACDEVFSLSGFKQQLLELMGDYVGKSAKSPEPVVSSEIAGVLTPNSKNLNQTDRITFPSMPRPLFEGNDGHKEPLNSSTGSQPQSPTQIQPQPQAPTQVQPQPKSKLKLKSQSEAQLRTQTLIIPQRFKTYILLGLVILLAFVWNSYFEQQQDAYFYTISGVSILLIDAWFVFSFIGVSLPWLNREADSDSLPKLMGDWSTQTQQRKEKEESLSEQADIQSYYRDLHQHTTLLTSEPSNATVFLGAQGGDIKPNEATCVIVEVCKQGSKQQFPLKGDSFLIGRGEAAVDYAEDEVGVSRQHAEIFNSIEGYGVKDLGSKNGTFLNEEQLVPYQSYCLNEGDTIRIVRTEFRLRKAPCGVL